MKYIHINNQEMFTDIIKGELKQIEIARKYTVSAASVSTAAKRIKMLKYPPKFVDEKLVCYICGNKEHLVIHHQHSTNTQIAIICQSCNKKVGDNELIYVGPFSQKKSLTITFYASDTLETSKQRYMASKDKRVTYSEFIEFLVWQYETVVPDLLRQIQKLSEKK